ncbi:hypothetical protein CLPU_15c00650 [Gottschalkia purinilytica]|uniref:Radical SAM core domain-containing protein n=1 Tax=Gottschalkia purinilytica TaxID=1503 RepID=A0A0L0W805_GOTPU|nr:radical SAM protein [Gottschalkia purinilytica]KNF07571.1 hypothetical protein CLPU_15c00650 [Gottschalkia purinilytica]
MSSSQLLGLKLLDGQSTVHELIHKINVSIPDSLQESYIQLVKNIALNYPTEINEIEKASKVSTLYLVLTDKCNSKCLYCFRDINNSSDCLSKDDIKKVITSFKNISDDNPDIVYTGGEPCLFSDLMEIASYAKQIGIKNTLQTNGLLISQENISSYADLFDTVQMSLDSTNEEMNDWLRGKKGHYKAVSNAVDLLLKHNVKVRLAATVTKKNFYDILNINKEFPEVKFQFTPMLKIGKGKEVASMAFTPEEFIEHITNLPEKDNILLTDNIYKIGTKAQICGAGTSVLSISSDGNVYPCQMLHHDDFSCGNIKNDSLENIYNTSKIINEFRNLEVDGVYGCKDCDIRYICGGGCRANSFWMDNDILGKDYFCKYNEQVYFYNLMKMFKKVTIKN